MSTANSGTLRLDMIGQLWLPYKTFAPEHFERSKDVGASGENDEGLVVSPDVCQGALSIFILFFFGGGIMWF